MMIPGSMDWTPLYFGKSMALVYLSLHVSLEIYGTNWYRSILPSHFPQFGDMSDANASQIHLFFFGAVEPWGPVSWAGPVTSNETIRFWGGGMEFGCFFLEKMGDLKLGKSPFSCCKHFLNNATMLMKNSRGRMGRLLLLQNDSSSWYVYIWESCRNPWKVLYDRGPQA